MSEDTKATLSVIGIFLGLCLLAVMFSATPSREDDPEGFYESQGYSCDSDCSGHDAGYEWARDNSVCDEYFNGGDSESFTEGVRAYAKTQCEE